MTRSAIIIGIGPGNGSSFVERFVRGDYRVHALSRSEESFDTVRELDGVSCHTFDATDASDVDEVLDRIVEQDGLPDVVLFNAGSGTWGGLDETSAGDLESAWRVNALGPFLVAKKLLPKMRERGAGVFGITGATASTRGKPNTTAFAQSKAAQRSLAQSFAREFGPDGVHVFYFIVDGMIDLPRTREQMPDKPDEFFLNPDDIAKSVWDVAHQPKSAWTFEFDLRPYCESW